MSHHSHPYGGPPGPPPQGRPYLPPPPMAPPPDPKAVSARRRTLLGLLGTVIGLPSFPCVAMALYQLISGDTSTIDGSIGMLVIFGFLSMISALLLFRAFRREKVPEFEIGREMERRVLEIARAHHGELSIAQLAVDSNLSIEESRTALDTMVERGAANLEVSEYGDTFYQFPTFLPKGYARASSDLDDFDQRLGEARESIAFDFEEVEQPHHQKK